MAKRKSKSKSKSKRGAARTKWISVAWPIGADTDLAMWLDRKSGELLAAEVCRRSTTIATLVALFEQLLADGRSKPSLITAGTEGAAIELRSRVDGVPVRAELDRRASNLAESMIYRAECLKKRREHRLSGGETIFTLKLTLRHTQPPIWRRVRIASDVTLYVLHAVIQEAMGWENCHLHQFRIDGVNFVAAEDEGMGEGRSELEVPLEDVFKAGTEAEYWYDFGDDWFHDIELERVDSAEPGEAIAACTGGARSCPPEDAGGPGGYEDKLRAAAAPQDDWDHEMAEWLGKEFDPEAFVLDHATARVREIFVTGRDSDGCLYDANVDPDPEVWLNELDAGCRRRRDELLPLSRSRTPRRAPVP